MNMFALTKRVCSTRVLVSGLLALAMLLCVLPAADAYAAEIVASGTCGAQGDNLTWTLDDECLLTISGTGDMADFGGEDADYNYGEDADYTAPWAPYRNDIKAIVIENGVTSIGDYAFFYCDSLTSVTIPNSVTRIGIRAFSRCESLTSVTIPGSVTSLERAAFSRCESLTSVTICNGVTSIGMTVFTICQKLTCVTIPLSVTSIGKRAFYFCRSLTDVYYGGSEEQWAAISIDNDNNWNAELLDANIHYNSAGPSPFDDVFGLVTNVKTEHIHGEPDDLYATGITLFNTVESKTYDFDKPFNVGSGDDYEGDKYLGWLINYHENNDGEFIVGEVDADGMLIQRDFGFSQDNYNIGFVPLYSAYEPIQAATDKKGYLSDAACEAIDEANERIEFLFCDYEKHSADGMQITEDTIVFKIITGDDGSYLFFDMCDGTDFINTEFHADQISIFAWEGNDITVLYLVNPSFYPIGVTGLSPSNGARNVGDPSGNGVSATFTITFSDNVDIYSGSTVSGDLSKGTISIYRASDDKLIWSEKESIWQPGVLGRCTGSGNKLSFSYGSYIGDSLLDYNTEYYITVDEGVIKLSGGKTNPAIKKGVWTFTTVNGDNSGTFAFRSHTGNFNAEYQYEYSDSFFYDSSYSGSGAGGYNHDLSKVSLDLALSAFNAYNGYNTYIYDKQNAARNVISFMHHMGFVDVDVDSYQGKPEPDSIAYAIGRKNITVDGTEYTLIALAVRGGGYEAEWASNFCIHSLSSHMGFSYARSLVYDGLKDYINENVESGSNIKLWITGYSRGAAVANLLAGMIDDGIKRNGLMDDYNLSREDVYAYTFATPMGASYSKTKNTADYNNIYNIVNPIDTVTKVAPAKRWSFSRYGCSLALPSVSTNSHAYSTYKEEVFDLAAEIGLEHIVTVEKTGAVDKTVDILASALYPPYRDNSILVQTLIGEEIGAVYGYGESPLQTIWEETEDERDLITALALLYKVLTGIESLPDMSNAEFEKLINGKVSSAVRAEVEEKLLIDDVKSWATGAVKDWAKDKIRAYLTALASAHYPELYLAWMNTIDESSLGDGLHRELYIDCPVDIEVYDEQGDLAASIIDNKACNIEGSFVSAYVDFDGQKVFVLPPDREYQFNILATDCGEMTYTVVENNADGETLKVVSYFEINIEENDRFTGSVEKIDDNDPAEYPLYFELDSSSERILPTIESSEDNVETYSVSIDVIGNGQAHGGGRFISGEFSNVMAEPEEGEEFLGWYVGDEMVSDETEYRFLVDQDTVIFARFSSVTGRVVSLCDYTGDASVISGIADGGRYSGEKTFTVTSEQACVVAYKAASDEDYTVLTASGSGSSRSFTVQVDEDTEIFIGLVGDVDLDGDVDRKDATLLSRFVAQWKDIKVDPLTADIDGAGGVARKDATLLSRRIAGWTTVKDYFVWE